MRPDPHKQAATRRHLAKQRAKGRPMATISGAATTEDTKPRLPSNAWRFEQEQEEAASKPGALSVPPAERNWGEEATVELRQFLESAERRGFSLDAQYQMHQDWFDKSLADQQDASVVGGGGSGTLKSLSEAFGLHLGQLSRLLRSMSGDDVIAMDLQESWSDISSETEVVVFDGPSTDAKTAVASPPGANTVMKTSQRSSASPLSTTEPPTNGTNATTKAPDQSPQPVSASVPTQPSSKSNTAPPHATPAHPNTASANLDKMEAWLDDLLDGPN